MTTSVRPRRSTSLPRIAKLPLMHVSSDERKLSTASSSSRQITVEINDTYRRRKSSDPSPIVSYCSFVPKPPAVLYI